MTRIKMDAEDRRKTIIDAACKLAAKIGSSNLTRRAIAKAATTKRRNCSEALVTVHLGTQAETRALIAKEMKKRKLSEPSAAKQEEIGRKLRAHGPRNRKPNMRDIARKMVQRETKPNPVQRETKPNPAAAPQTKTAARPPKAPPQQSSERMLAS